MGSAVHGRSVASGVVPVERVKAFMSGVYTHARERGDFPGANPLTGLLPSAKNAIQFLSPDTGLHKSGRRFKSEGSNRHRRIRRAHSQRAPRVSIGRIVMTVSGTLREKW
jgi:hypothetical protein